MLGFFGGKNKIKSLTFKDSTEFYKNLPLGNLYQTINISLIELNQS